MFTRILGSCLLALFVIATEVQAHAPDLDLTDSTVTSAAVQEPVKPAETASVLPVWGSESSPIFLVILGTAMVVAARLARRRRRRALCVVLALLLTLFAFESSVHAVHHLGDAHAATLCALAVASAQCSGIAPAVIDTAPVEVVEVDRVAPIEIGALPAAPARSQRDRAPPVSA